MTLAESIVGIGWSEGDLSTREEIMASCVAEENHGVFIRYTLLDGSVIILTPTGWLLAC